MYFHGWSSFSILDCRPILLFGEVCLVRRPYYKQGVGPSVGNLFNESQCYYRGGVPSVDLLSP